MSDWQAKLDEWTARGARLLHVERLPLRASVDPARALMLDFTFDCGVLRIEPGEGDMLALAIVSPQEPETGAAPADDEEPWWALLGHELCGVWLDVDVEGEAKRVRFQFRPDDQNPRFVRLNARDGQLRVRSDAGT